MGLTMPASGRYATGANKTNECLSVVEAAVRKAARGVPRSFDGIARPPQLALYGASPYHSASFFRALVRASSATESACEATIAEKSKNP